MLIKLRENKGSMAVYTSIVLLSMLLILTAVFLTSSAMRKSQLITTIKVKESYEADNDRAGDIYDALTGNVKPEYVKDGLILHYDAIDNTGSGHNATTTTWKDLSGNNNDATITGGTWENNHLKIATSNRDTNGIKTNNNFPINFTNTFNIVFQYTSDENVQPIFGSRSSTTNGFMLFNYVSNDGLALDTNGSNTRTKLTDRLKINTIYNLTLTTSNNVAKIYINGELINTVNITGTDLNLPLTIFSSNAQDNSVGNVYSVKVYNRELTEQEIKQNYDTDNSRIFNNQI